MAQMLNQQGPVPAGIDCIRVSVTGGIYTVRVGSGLIHSAGRLLAEACADPRRAFLVSNPTVSRLWLGPVVEALEAGGCRVDDVIIGDGEEFKTLDTVAKLYELLAAGGHDRRTVAVALGGGVVGDVVGFAAATYMRGIRLVHIPTTLLAQVDSSIGGKTAVNHAGAKNLVGAFHQPILVLSDTDTLSTLPRCVFVEGMAEVIKTAVIKGDDLFEFVEANAARIGSGDADSIRRVVAECARLKASVIAGDERDEAGRMVLNLGHTFGHALESACGYQGVSHGAAVAAGLCLAADLAHRIGMCGQGLVSRLSSLVTRFGLPASIADLDICLEPEAIERHMLTDKKRRHGAVRFVLPVALGEVRVVEGVSPAAVRAALELSCKGGCS